MSQSRYELLAATMNAHTGEIAWRSLQSNHKGKLKLTDSSVVLHWVSKNQKPVKPCVENRVVVELLRYAQPSE